MPRIPTQIENLSHVTCARKEENKYAEPSQLKDAERLRIRAVDSRFRVLFLPHSSAHLEKHDLHYYIRMLQTVKSLLYTDTPFYVEASMVGQIIFQLFPVLDDSCGASADVVLRRIAS